TDDDVPRVSGARPAGAAAVPDLLPARRRRATWRSPMPHPILPGAEPFTLEGGDTGVLLVHGFTGSPQGLRPWGEALHAAGLTVHCPLLPGHGTHWEDLVGVRWRAWVGAVKAAYDRLLAAGMRAGGVGALSLGGGLGLRPARHAPRRAAWGGGWGGAPPFGGGRALPLAAHDAPRLRGLVLVNPYLRDRRDWRLPLLP